MTRVQIGLESFLDNPPQWLGGCRLGLLCNSASVDRRFRHARDLIADRFPGKLTALFSPQHGFFGEKQDNMIESGDWTDPFLGIPVFSLYSRTREPTRKMFDKIDVLLVDLQDAGTRVYTFVYTMSYCMEAARRFGKKLIVLDRPNPVNGITIEGNCLSPDCFSFVGRYPIPMRHAMTIGEMALMFNRHFGIRCDLEVVAMKNWRRRMYFRDTGLEWIPPSPNLPTPESAVVYPGQVIWEGTNVSEGRGTTQPFELFGAPFIEPRSILAMLEKSKAAGVHLRQVAFEPTANKWAGQPCHGFQLHITDPQRYQPYTTSLRLLQAVIHYHPDQFQWKPPPYEYEFKRRPIDLIIGSVDIRKRIAAMAPIDDICAAWQDTLDDYAAFSRAYHLYR
jgi:uncharacterized protein YbbC (DUF1343 family)